MYLRPHGEVHKVQGRHNTDDVTIEAKQLRNVMQRDATQLVNFDVSSVQQCQQHCANAVNTISDL